MNYSCFNPYSIGFYSFIYDVRFWIISLYGVSILILLDSILLWSDTWRNGWRSILFQSLFYWILFFYYPWYWINFISFSSVSILILLDSLLLWSKEIKTTRSLCGVSILILLDSLLLSTEEAYIKRGNILFQSLFYWILFFYYR